jgi:signal transduction histidine kinase/ActR/RegA family two-component response regulator
VKRRALAAGADDLVARPLDSVELARRVQNHLETRRLHGLLHARHLDLEALVQRRTAQILQAEKLATMSELLGGVAHELNNPLTIVTGYAQMLARHHADAATRGSALKLEQAAARCARIVKNFLAMARQWPPERTRVSLHAVIHDAVELFAYQLRTAGVALTLDLDPSGPVLDADAHQLHQVVINLANNARQAMAGQDAPRRLTIRTRITAGWVTIEVEDTGPGIPAEIRARVFDAFFTTKPAGEGTGLGLTLCRSIVESHGGTMRLDSAPGGGARFTIELPTRAPAPPPPAPDDHPERQAVLVVDDEPDVGEVLATLLEGEGHHVDRCASAREALDRVARHVYDVVIVDDRMPDLDGMECAQALARRAPWTRGRIALYTGDSLNQRLAEFIERSGTPTIAKPFALDDVRRLLQQFAPARAGRAAAE